MALDFSEAAAYYGLFTFLSVFALTSGVVDVPAGTVPYYYVVAKPRRARRGHHELNVPQPLAPGLRPK